jgi:hypothetical protein
MRLTGSAPASLRALWLIGTIVLTVGAFAFAISSAPADGTTPYGLFAWVLIVGSSVHVASTAWFYAVPDVRRYARAHPIRYIYVPIGLVVGGAVAGGLLPAITVRWALLGFFAWQFFHFQKQNIGMAALAGVSQGGGSVRPLERRAIIAAGCAGIVGLISHPELLQLALPSRARFLFPAAAAVFAMSVAVGVVALLRRQRGQRPAAFVTIYLISLLFFAPVFIFTSPYAAVAGLTIAHGYQYLLIVGMVAGAQRIGGSRFISLLILINVAVFGGVLLNGASHLHDRYPIDRALFGAYLGLVMAHFVVDAGLWRLRDEFPRAFLGERLPYLIPPRKQALAGATQSVPGD